MLEWIRNYLHKREQRVKYNRTTSTLKNMTCGVPPSSIVGPLLVIIYINVTTVPHTDKSTCKQFKNIHEMEITQQNKCKFLYSAVSIPHDRSKRFTLYFPDRPVHSDTISTSLGSIQPYAAINARRLLVHISTTVYSQEFIYSAE